MGKKNRAFSGQSTKRIVPEVAPKMVVRGSLVATQQDIARRAFELYMDEGQPDGRHEAHWLRAEAELRR